MATKRHSGFLPAEFGRIGCLCVALLSGIGIPATSIAVDFESEIAPLFAEHCLDCHGPETQKGQFRLDRLASLLKGGDSGEAAVVPGKPAGSFLVKAIRHDEPDYEMPPKGGPLSEAEISRVEQWIAEGAKVPEHYGPATEEVELTHWSFVPVKRPESADSIDGFIERKLEENGLSLSEEADRRTLIRRLYFVMLGLPPRPEEVEAFVADEDPGAWKWLVERVLASPHYGERWATHWLDLVRFGETQGFEMNRERPNAWHYRDWVIDSFNSDKPYDQFVREQIAGDALGADIGTGFLVAGPFDQVKGKDPKLRQMQRMNELDDIINTTGTAFLGLTTGCARCHNHKFDPISQQDYYALQAVFAGVLHGDRALPLPEKTKQQIAELDRKIADLEEKLTRFLPTDSPLSIAIDDTEAEALQKPRGRAEKTGGPSPNLGRNGYTWWSNVPGKDIASWHPEVRGRYRIWISWGAGYSTHSSDARYLLRSGNRVTEIARTDQQRLADGSGKPESRALWSGLHDAGVHALSPEDAIVLRGGETGTAITADAIFFQPVGDDENESSEAPVFRPAVSPLKNVERFPPRLARFVRIVIEETNSGEPCIDELEIFAGERNVALASNGAKARSSGDFVHPKHKLAHINDGRYGNDRSWIAKQAKGGWVQIELPETVAIDRIEWARDRSGEFRDRLATRYRIEVATESGEWSQLAHSSDRLTHDQKKEPSREYRFTGILETEAEEGRAWLAQLESARKQRASLRESTLVYAGKFEQPGPTHRLYRGEPDAKREEVSPGAISAFSSLELPRNAPEQERRLAIANWIASEENPLTARVIANRIWQFHFGAGLVDTPSDFGRNGVPPTHPELLDWLATELVSNGWSLKHLHRVLLHSTTWKQDHRPRPEALKIDATSRLLWRFPPRRLEAEGIRDAILSASGVLDLETAGGPGFSAFEIEAENVRHYHPKKKYGPEDWRRMIYMTKVRQEKDVVFGTFDCPDASQAVAKRSRSTTPLQALNLLNSHFVMQQAELFAKRLEAEAESTNHRVERAWQLCFHRSPDHSELTDAIAFIEDEGLVQFTRALFNANEFVFIP